MSMRNEQGPADSHEPSRPATPSRLSLSDKAERRLAATRSIKRPFDGLDRPSTREERRPSRSEEFNRPLAPSASLNVDHQEATLKSLLHRLDPQVVPETSADAADAEAWMKHRKLLLIVGAGAIVFGVAVAMIFLSIATSVKNSGPSSSPPRAVNASKPEASQSQSLPASSEGDQPLKQSDRVLQQFMKWRQKDSGQSAQ